MGYSSSTIQARLALFEQLWAHSPDNMFEVILDAEGDFVVVDLNPSQANNLGMRVESMRGKKIRELFDADVVRVIEEKYHRCLASNAPRS